MQLNIFKSQFFIFLSLFFIILTSTYNITLILDYLNWFILLFIVCYLFYNSTIFIQLLLIPIVAYSMQLITFLIILKSKLNVNIL